MWFVPITENNPYRLGRTLTALKAELLRRVRNDLMPIADVELLAARYPAATVWINPEGGHMGRSPQWAGERIFAEVTAPWLARMLELS